VPAFVPLGIGSFRRRYTLLKAPKRDRYRFERLDVIEIFDLPTVVIRSGERSRIINLDAQFFFTAWPDIESNPRIRSAIHCENEHDRPVGSAKDTSKRLLVSRARLRAVPRMGMNPDPSELFGPASFIYLPVEEVGDRLVVELDMRERTVLLDDLNIFDKQRVIVGRDPESANLGFAVIT